MNEEEKKAIEYLKEIQEIVLKSEDDEDIIVDCRIVGRIQILLNLIDKQQKEIDKQNKVIDEKEQEIEYLNCIIESDKDNYINKDKIKAKIEEYDDKGMTVNLANRSAGKTFQQAVHYEIKKVLQSLLEKE